MSELDERLNAINDRIKIMIEKELWRTRRVEVAIVGDMTKDEGIG